MNAPARLIAFVTILAITFALAFVVGDATHDDVRPTTPTTHNQHEVFEL